MNDFAAGRIHFTPDPVTCEGNINEYSNKGRGWMEKKKKKKRQHLGVEFHLFDW